MNPSYFPTLAALIGTVVGGLTSFLTSWTTTTAQTRAQRMAAEKSKREELFGHFLEEMARLYARAFSEDKVDYGVLVQIFALKGRIELVASKPVSEASTNAIKHILDVYIGPNLSPAEVRALLDDPNSNFLGRFAEVCRLELQAFEMA